jgi:hypothetical protein
MAVFARKGYQCHHTRCTATGTKTEQAEEMRGKEWRRSKITHGVLEFIASGRLKVKISCNSFEISNNSKKKDRRDKEKTPPEELQRVGVLSQKKGRELVLMPSLPFGNHGPPCDNCS